MAENDNTGDDTPGNGNGGDDEIIAATSIYEARLLIAAASLAVDTLTSSKTAATPVELGVLTKLLKQAAEALEEGHSAMFRLFGVAIGHA